MLHLLTDQQKKQRVECPKDLRKMFASDGPKRLCGGVTGDETCLYFYDIPKKRSNQMWVAADGKRPLVLQPDFQRWRRLFFVCVCLFAFSACLFLWIFCLFVCLFCFCLFVCFQHTGSSHSWYSTLNTNTHWNILCWNCSARSDQISTSAAPNRWHR